MDSLDPTVNNRQQTTETLEVALQGLSLRSKAISSNIANISTPNYHRRTVDFEQTLMEQVNKAHKLSDIPINKTNAKHFSNDVFEINQLKGSLEMNVSNDGTVQNNGNNVDIDREMIELTKTGLRYKAVAQMTKKHFEGLRGIIRGG